MKLKIIFLGAMLFVFSNCLQANDRYLTQIFNIFATSNFNAPEKNELAQKANDDLCKRMKSAIGLYDIPDFLYKNWYSWQKGKGFYKIIYHMNNSGKLEFKSWVSTFPNATRESIDIEQLSKPIDFDFSTISEEEILNGLTSELAKADATSKLKEAILPVLQQDLLKKLSSKKEESPFYPRFLGGISDYIVDFYLAEDGQIEVDTLIFYTGKSNYCSIKLLPLRYPVNFDYSKITEEEIKEKLTEVFAQPTVQKQLVVDYAFTKSDCDILLSKTVNDLKLRLTNSTSRYDVPDFLGGVAKYRVCFYMKEQPDETKSPVISSSGYYRTSEKNTIKFEKSGLYRVTMLSK